MINSSITVITMKMNFCKKSVASDGVSNLWSEINRKPATSPSDFAVNHDLFHNEIGLSKNTSLAFSLTIEGFIILDESMSMLGYVKS